MTIQDAPTMLVGKELSMLDSDGFGMWVKQQVTNSAHTTQADMARSMRISPKALQNWMSRRTSPTIETLQKAAAAFNVPLFDVLVGSGYLHPDTPAQPLNSELMLRLRTVELIAEIRRRLVDNEAFEMPSTSITDAN